MKLTFKHLIDTVQGFMQPRSIGRFALVGGFNTLVGIGAFPLLYWLFRNVMGVNTLLVLSWVISTFIAFISHKRVTFASDGNAHHEGGRFLILSLILLGMNMAVMNLVLAHTNLNPVVVQLGISGTIGVTMMVLNYLGLNHFVFKSRDDE